MVPSCWRWVVFACVAWAIACTVPACSPTDDAARSSASARVLLERTERLVAGDPRLSQRLAPSALSFARDPDDLARRFVSSGFRSAAEQRFSELGVRLPETAAGAVEVGVSRFARTRLRVTLEDARPVTPTVHEGRVVYLDALPSTARVFAASQGSLEELLVLGSARAPAAFNYRIELPEGIARVDARDGGLVFLDEAGRSTFYVAPPYAIDATGTRRDASLVWNDASGTATLGVDTRGLVFPVAVDPSIDLALWTEVPNEEPRLARSAHALAFDAARNEVVMFGGYRPDGGYSGETWRWNGTAWRLAAPATSPPGRVGHAMTYDNVRRELVCFGGSANAGGTLFNDTWRWNGVTWTQATPATSPFARFGAAMAFDESRGEAILFGGGFRQLPQGVLGDTWRWDGTNWTAAPGTPPGSRVFASMAYDRGHGELILFGGYGAPGGFNSTTWRWSGSAWSQATVATPPPGRYEATLAFDDARNQLVLFGGSAGANTAALNDTWLWNGTDWTSVAPATSAPVRYNAASAFDSTRGEMIVFGGNGALGGTLADTWRWNGTDWTIAAPPTAPTGRFGAGMAYDVLREEVILFGGGGASAYLNDTWRWNGVAWSRLSPAGAPPARAHHGMVYDTTRKEIVLFGGMATATVVLVDTWRWNGTTWSQAAPATSPSPRTYFAMTFEAMRGTALLFGGRSGTGLADTWRWDGTTWTLLAPPSSPPPRFGAAIAFDATHNEVVLFGGTITSAPANDTWRWDGSTWTEAIVAIPPPGRANHRMVFDSNRGDVVAFGGAGQSGPLFDTLRWNGNAWIPIAPPIAPTARHSFGVAFDGRRDEVVLHGGVSSANAFLADSWRLFNPGSGCSADAQCLGTTRCVDGVCCNTAQCGTCETCAGVSPGECTPVFNREDADTCTNGKSCNAVGECKGALGAPVSLASECASGVLVDGVCCDSACTGPCLACRKDLKESDSLSGRCDFAKHGTDTRDHCAATDPTTCGEDGTCDGRGRCRLREPTTPCGPVACVDGRATGRTCDGSGTCRADAAGTPCGLYACNDGTGCRADCSTNADCALRSVCDASTHRCVPEEGARCDGNAVVRVDGTREPCGAYICEGAQCKTRCTNILDCWGGASCDFDSHCVTNVVSTDQGGCGVAGTSHGGSPMALLCVLMFIRRRRIAALALVVVTCSMSARPRAKSTASLDPFAGTGLAHDARLAQLFAPHGNELCATRGERDALSVRLPSATDSATTVTASNLASTRLRMTLEDAQPRAAALHDAHAVYADVFTDTTRVFACAARTLEEVLVLASADAPRAFAYRLDLPATVRRVDASDGGLILRDEASRALYEIPEPYAIDALGARRTATLTWNDDAHIATLALDVQGLAFPVILDPSVDLGTWAKASPAVAPSPRNQHGYAYDAARHQVVLFGGYTLTGAVGDTWLWNGASWTSPALTVAPSARASTAMTFDGVRGNVVLFGGDASAETWIWDGTAWSQLAPAQSPPARNGHGMVFDSVRGEAVLFGGRSGGARLNDTWRWNGTTWSQASTAVAPQARADFGMAFDSVRQEIIVFGGEVTGGAARLNDTWRWNGTIWTQAFPMNVPTARTYPSMTFDSARGDTFLFGGASASYLGDTWRWDGTSWFAVATQLAPAPSGYMPAVFDTANKEIVRFGGVRAVVNGPQVSYYNTDDTWIYSHAGARCTTTADCRGMLTCVDGACCRASSCGSCETCNGFAPGRCTAVTNTEDPDTCAVRDGKSCNDTGACKAALGMPATSDADCATGFDVDGVCCDQRCNGSCMACRADLKASDSRSGLCDFAKAGTDIRDQCTAEDPSTCGRDGACDGRGACRAYAADTVCGALVCVDDRATPRVCDGRGACGTSATGLACGAYACRADSGCTTTCATNADCAPRSHCDGGACVADASARCQGTDVIAVDGARTACAPYICAESQCKTECASIADCAAGAECDFSHHCVDTSANPNDVGCTVTHAAPHTACGLALLLLARRKKRVLTGAKRREKRALS